VTQTLYLLHVLPVLIFSHCPFKTGSHNLGAALEELKKRIFDLDVMKSKEFKMTKIQEFLNFLLSQKGSMFFFTIGNS
jgi:hypothetical protein